MNIAVVGAGAMGCLFGCQLARAGEQVTLVDHIPDKVALLQQRGVLLHTAAGTERIAVSATTHASQPAELVVVCVKAQQTPAILATVRDLCAPTTQVLTLQNGLGAAAVLATAVAPENLLVGTTAQGATLLGPGEIRHGGNGPTLVGPHLPAGTSPAAVVDAFTRAGLETSAVADPLPAVWKKLAVNCGINAITALTAIRNGRIPEIPAATALCRTAVREAVAVARTAGIDLGPGPEVADAVLEVARATAANRSSMGQDVDRRRATEVAYINGAVVEQGRRHGIPTPVNETLTQLIQTLEATYET